ncbi:MAG: hypothetical protein LPK02_10990 [Rhodobacterales bacterium]|nr:hypothetical protein [Rhodobacterales bacterium]MDX5413558.1 hypothetical protein [Rhodobacterales bacterium]
MTRFSSLHILWTSLVSRIGRHLEQLLPLGPQPGFAQLQPLPVPVSQPDGRRGASKGRDCR